MNELELVFNRNGRVFADSREVARRFGKQHAHVLREIERLCTHPPILEGGFFKELYSVHPTVPGRFDSHHEMARDGFMLLAMGFTGKKALQWKLRFIEAFNRMEAEFQRLGRQQPFHLRRYTENYPNVPQGYFSVLTAMTQHLIARLDHAGYELPERMWPDISEGQYFAKWIRGKEGFDPSDVKAYLHTFEDKRRAPVRPFAYPYKYYGDFVHHMEAIWIPNHAWRYFSERDPAALPYVEETCRFLIKVDRKVIAPTNQLSFL